MNNKIYIGQTVELKDRWRQHKYFARSKPVQYIHKAMRKYGIDNFIFEEVACSLSQEGIDEAEIMLIAYYDSRNPDKGYNKLPGGDVHRHDAASREHQRQKMIEWHTNKKTPEQQVMMSAKMVANRDYSKGNFSFRTPEHYKRVGVLISQAKKDVSVGQINVNRKFTPDQATAIKEAFKAGAMMKELAKQYNCHRQTISRIIGGKYYKEIV